MIDLEQKIIIKWTNSTKKYYEEKGYKYTFDTDEFEIKAKDLKPNSDVEVWVECDHCHSKKKMQMKTYKKLHKDIVSSHMKV